MADSKRSIGGSDQPITRHPLFPAIVALWFGALAGLGSVLVSASTIEGLVLSLGIDKVIPMTAPPLGTTMRILLALAMTGLGAAIGGVIARRIAGSGTVQRSDRDASADEPQSAAAPRRRRSLAIEQEAAPLAQEHAPLPGNGQGAQILDVSEFDLDAFDAASEEAPLRRAPQAAVMPQDAADAEEEDNLPAWLDAESAWQEPETTFGRAAERGVFTTPPGAQVFQARLDAAEQAAAQEAPIGSRLFEAYSREFSPRDADSAHAGEEADAVAESTDETPAPGFQILPRLPQGDWNAPDDIAEPVATDFAAKQAPAFEDEHFAAQAPVEAPGDDTADVRSAAERIGNADLDTLSPVELLERLALAMQRRREDARIAAEEAAAAPVAAAAAPAPEPIASIAPFPAPVIPIGDAAMQGAVEVESPWPPAPSAALPTALRPIALDPIEDALDDGHEPMTGYAPPRSISLARQEFRQQAPLGHDIGGSHADFDPQAAIPAPFPSSPFSTEAEADEDEDDDVLQQGYSSLLNLSRHAAVRKPFLQFGEPDQAGDEEAHATPLLEAHEERQPAPFGRPVLAPAPDPLAEAEPPYEERPFDAPGNDPEATERALRAALATLQRMSGAA